MISGMFSRIKQAAQKVVNSVRNTVKKEFRPAKEVSLNSVTPFRQKYIVKASRHQKRIDWCRDFNRRNGNIVSAKSPISIYFATHK